ncbi:MAG: hypothetical protein Aurels2KO_35490 [Aureliella sp.]
MPAKICTLQRKQAKLGILLILSQFLFFAFVPSGVLSSASGQTRNRYRENARKASPRPGSRVVRAAAEMPSVMQDTAIGYEDHHQPKTLEPISVHPACDSYGGIQAACRNYLFDWSRADLWVGATGFTGPASQIGTPASPEGNVGGAFGFQEGFNFGAKLPSLLSGQLGSQIGVRLTHTSFDGSTAGADRRNQMFLTAGLFRRVDYGLQGGLVIDYLHDDWVYKADLLQLRGELSFLLSESHELGFRFTDSQQMSSSRANVGGNPVDVSLQTLDTYRFFYRVLFGPQARGTAELMGGFSSESSSLWGVKLKLPLQGELGLETNMLYSPAPSEAAMPYSHESWNVSMALVWTPGRGFGAARDYYRPLLDVADNASMLVERIMP